MKKAYILLHDIRSVHNVGSIFRTADALGIHGIYLSGHTPTPLDRFGNIRKDLAKVALGAEKTIPWEYKDTAKEIIQNAKKAGWQIVAVEQSPQAIDYKNFVFTKDTLFVFGNEVSGVDREILKECDVIVEIPMKGVKESLNVSVCVGVALFRMLGI